LNAFRVDRLRVLVATDIASRGIDVDGITHVINFDLPEETESYVHRIGRTARAGADGAAIAFVSYEERGLLRAIERMIRKPIEIEAGHEFHSEKAERAAGKGVPDHLPRPAWAPNKDRRPGAGHPANAGRPQRRGNLGRNQPDFKREPADRGDQSARPVHAPVAGSPVVQERAPDAERPPRLDDVRGERPKRTFHHPGDKPRSGKPGVAGGHQHEGGGARGGVHKPRSSRPPWMV
jgi:ATP-dependent RNA helicase RhlE